MILKKSFEENRIKKFEKARNKAFLSLIRKGYEKSLDVGCGKGFWDYLGAREGKFKNVSGCDIFSDFQSDEICQVAQSVEYKNISEGKFPFADDIFDLVFSMDVIEHVEDDLALVLEKIRVTKSGGKIIIGTPNRFRVGNLPLLLTGKLKYPRILGHDSYGDVVHLREYKKADLQSILGKVGSFIDQGSVQIEACFFGVPAFDVGLEQFPGILDNFCQFWFVSFNKK